MQFNQLVLTIPDSLKPNGLFVWLVADGWWLVCSERKVLLAGG
jgi:hypothetical protein